MTKKKLYKRIRRIGYNYYTEYLNEKDMIKYLKKYNKNSSMREIRKKLNKFKVHLKK